MHIVYYNWCKYTGPPPQSTALQLLREHKNDKMSIQVTDKKYV